MTKTKKRKNEVVWNLALEPYPVNLTVSLLHDQYMCGEFIRRHGAGTCSSNRPELKIFVTLTARDAGGVLRSEFELLELVAHEFIHVLQDLEMLVEAPDSRFDCESEAYVYERLIARTWPRLVAARNELQKKDEAEAEE